jgi:hypothetical protein
MRAIIILFLLFPNLIFSQNYFSACKQIPLNLGNGFDISNPAELKQRAFESSESIYDEESAETSISYSIVHNQKEFQRQIEKDVSINARFLSVSTSASFELSDEIYTSDNYTTIIFKANSNFGSKGLESYNLKPEAKALIDSSNYDLFIERYGTHYVQKISTGIELSFFISFENSYYEVDENNSAEGNIGVSIINSELSINNALKKAINEKALHVQIYSNGPKDAISSLSDIIRYSDNPIEQIQSDISNYLKEFNRSSSKTIGYFYSPFSQYGIPKSKINWNIIREKNLIDIKTEYELASSNYNILLSNRNECIYIKGKDDVKKSFDSILVNYKAYLDSIIKCHNKCLDLSDSYYNSQIFNMTFDENPYYNLVGKLMEIVNIGLKDIIIPVGNIITWEFNDICSQNLNCNINFTADLFKDEAYNSVYPNYLLKPKIKFIVNDDVIGTYIFTLNDKGILEFNKNVDLYLTEGVVKFQLLVIEINGIGPNGEEKTFNKWPFYNGHLKVKVNSDY